MSKALKPLVEKKASTMLVSFSAVIAGLFAGALLLMLIGKNPLDAVLKIATGALSNPRRIGQTIAVATQLILVGLSVSFAFKTGLFNIGGSGQMLVGGTVASIIAYYVTGLPRPLYLVIIILSGMLSGSAWGFISGYLKARFNVHEVVSSIMLNWTAVWIVYEVVFFYIVDPAIVSKSMAVPAAQSLRTPLLAQFFPGSYINWGIVIALVAILVVKFILDKTTLGFQLKAVGANKYCAEYAGIKVNRNIMVSMAIAGALAGLAGVTFYCGYSNIIFRGQLPGEGFDGIAVALLGNSHPIGVFFSAIFFSILEAGKGSLGAGAGIPPEITDIIIATIIYFTATALLFRQFWNRIFKKRYENKLKRMNAESKNKGVN